MIFLTLNSGDHDYANSFLAHSKADAITASISFNYNCLTYKIFMTKIKIGVDFSTPIFLYFPQKETKSKIFL